MRPVHLTCSSASSVSQGMQRGNSWCATELQGAVGACSRGWDERNASSASSTLRRTLGFLPAYKLARPLARRADYGRDLAEAEEQADQRACLECSRRHAEVEAG